MLSTAAIVLMPQLDSLLACLCSSCSIYRIHLWKHDTYFCEVPQITTLHYILFVSQFIKGNVYYGPSEGTSKDGREITIR